MTSAVTFCPTRTALSVAESLFAFHQASAHRHSLNSPRPELQVQMWTQFRMEAQTLAELLRLMSTSSSEEKVGDGFSTVCPLSVVLGPSVTSSSTCQLQFPAMLVFRRPWLDRSLNWGVVS